MSAGGASSTRYDAVVVGAGIVGLATARELLARRPAGRVLVVEKEDRIAAHQTSHNSGVIHAGVYYAPGSLKARLCRAGARATKEFCAEHRIPLRTTGKLVVATNERELARLDGPDGLEQRSRANGLTVERLGSAELAEREPMVRGLGALWVPDSGIVSYSRVAEALAEDILREGGSLRLNTRVTGIEEKPREVRLRVQGAVTDDEEIIVADRLVVCAGLQSDRLAALGGLGGGFSIIPFRGEYFHLPPERSDVVSSLIYPVPDPGLPFLGVHLSPTIDGLVTVGPNAVLGAAREGYRKYSLSPADLRDIAGFPGSWRMARGKVRTGLREMRNSTFRRGYLRECRRYLPDLGVRDLQPATAGIRAQAVRSDGTLVDDFLWRSSERQLHVCNAPSPAATAAMPIASMIADRFWPTEP
ncbi:L-2-hydroxyglutarate oxidase [Ruania rhizosphaerae]|uniref:L-2-hydroxyglutarate oxidase n=1 Tax=Ruania rhizosphaerae TaxID=1840413 RepID=UPI00135B88E0|nr:L-2-hydroxyglutarate oxidase [Ruania rhizosphaerae]